MPEKFPAESKRDWASWPEAYTTCLDVNSSDRLTLGR